MGGAGLEGFVVGRFGGWKVGKFEGLGKFSAQANGASYLDILSFAC